MIFEQFLKEVRKKSGLTQKELAERAFTTYQNISSYERLRTECSFDIGMNLLNALGISVILENNQIFVKEGKTIMKDNKWYEENSNGITINADYIKVKEGNDKMESKYTKENLGFINFNSDKIKEEMNDWVKKNQELNKNQLREVLNELENKGFDVYLTDKFNENLWYSDYYNNEDDLAIISKDGKEIMLSVVGYLDIDYFLLENFIDDISKKYPEEAIFIEKAIIYSSYTNENGGHDIYEAFKYNPNNESILNVLSMLSGYENIILEFLTSENYFYTLTEGHNPEELTISDYIRIYDCSSSTYLYYSFTMPTEDRVLAEESFEGHDIVDALKYAPAYFEDYDRYLEEYNDEDSRDDLIIF